LNLYIFGYCFFSLFDKDEATEKQAPELNKSNSLNENRDEASEFMLAISTPSPNDSMIESVESSSSTSKYVSYFWLLF
jgi:hypothetical protein